MHEKTLRATVCCMAGLVLVLLGMLAGCSDSPSWPPPTTTVLIYLEGTNLEENEARATANIKEMLAAASAPHLNVVLTTGAADKSVATDPVTSWRTVKRHLIKDGKIQELQDLGPLNMGMPEVLTDFIRWGQTTFPADKYILIFWDHGSGPLWGFGGNFGTNTSGMSLMQIRKAIGDAVSVTGRKLELIGFDACLMASVEIAANLAPFASFMVASEEIIPKAGWDYRFFLNYLAAHPEADGLATGTAIANGYLAKTESETDTYTLSVIDLARIDAVLAAIDDFARLAVAQSAAYGRTAWNQLAALRNLTDEFAPDYVNNIFHNLADLGHFAALAAEGDSVYRQSAARIQAAVAQAVRYNVTGEGHSLARGLSIYFPLHNLENAQGWFYRYEEVAFVPSMQAFLKPFIAFPLDNPPGSSFSMSDPRLEPTTLRAEVNSPYAVGEQFITIAQDASKNGYTMLGMDLATVEPLGGDRYSVRYARDNRWFTLDGHHVTVYFEYRENSDIFALVIPALYRPKGAPAEQNRPVNLSVRYNYLTNSGTILAAWEGIQASAVTARQNVDLNNGDLITPVFLTIDISTLPETVTYSYGTPFAMSDEKMSFSRSPIPAGSYFIFFQVTDLAGNKETSNPVTLSVASATKQAMPTKVSAVPLQQGFWSRWQ